MIVLRADRFNAEGRAALIDLLTALRETTRLFRTTEGALLLISHDQDGIPCGVLPIDSIVNQLEGAGLLQILRGGQGAAVERPVPAYEKAGITKRLHDMLKDPMCARILPTITSLVNAPAAKIVGRRIVRRAFPFEVGDHGDKVFCLGSLEALPPPAADYPLLRLLWSGVRFSLPIYHANLVGYTVAMLARTGFSESHGFPLLLLDSRYKSSGKSQIADALGYLLTGRLPLSVTYTGKEEEMERRFSDLVDKPGPNFIVFDNIRGKRGPAGAHTHQVRSQFLAQLATRRVVYPRTLYKGPHPLFDAIVALTMNGAVVEQDLADRVIRIGVTRSPGAVQEPLIPHPLEVVKEHRQGLLAEIFDILSKIELVGARDRTHHTRFYYFEQILEAGARAAGLTASLDPSLVDSADAFVRELVSLLVPDEPTPFETIRGTVIVEAGAHELRAWFDRLDGATKHHWRELRTACLDLVGRRFRIDGSVFAFEVHDEALVLRKEAV